MADYGYHDRDLVERPVSADGFRAYQIWALIGAALLLVQLYFTIKWVFSDSFVAVPVGPDLPPLWMRYALDIGQIGITALWCGTFYWFVIRGYRKTGRLSLEALIVIGSTLASFWDALSNIGQFWFAYNTYLFNRGSVLDVMPFTLSPRSPGATEAWPIFFITTLYGNFVYISIGVSGLLRSVKARRPKTSAITMLAICFALGCVVDIILEGMILLPLGFWSYAGGHWAINSHHYYKYPLHEAMCVGAVFAALGWIRYSVNDRGQSICERGLQASRTAASETMRILAVLGGVISIYIVCYHLPGVWIGLNSAAWPADVQQRSYLTSNICGPVVDIACPSPTTPVRRNSAPYLDMSGNMVRPSGASDPR